MVTSLYVALSPLVEHRPHTDLLPSVSVFISAVRIIHSSSFVKHQHSEFPNLVFVKASSGHGLKPNTHRRRRRDETVESRRVGVGGVYMNSQLAHDDCRRIQSTIWKLAKQTVSVSVSVS